MEFVVGLNFDEGVVEICNCYGMFVVLGIMMLIEVIDVYFVGVDFVKVFFVFLFGFGYFKSMKGLFL